MTMFKIETPDTLTVGKSPRGGAWSASATCDVSRLSPEIVGRLAMHGLHQKIADSAAGSATKDEAEASMSKVIASLIAGDWATRSVGTGATYEVQMARLVTRRLVKDKFGSKSPKWAAFTGLSDQDQLAKLDQWFADNEAALAPERDAEIARRAEAKQAKAKAGKAVTFTL